MSVETATQLKTYFQTGDVPTEAQFVNLIDSSVGSFVDVPAYLPAGYVTDGSVDYTTELQAAVDAATAAGLPIRGCPGTFKIGSTLTLTCNGDLSMMTIAAAGASVSPAVQIGASNDYLFNVTLRLPSVTNTSKTTTGWTGFDTSVGVEMKAVYSSRIYAKEIRGFGVGLFLSALDGKGCVYNEIYPGTLVDNKINLKLYPVDDGWVNENVFIGGRLTHSSAEGVQVSGTKQIYMGIDDTSSTNPPNNNLFVKPSVEGDTPEYHLDIQGAFNQFVAPRLEISTSSSPVTSRVRYFSTATKTCDNNLIVGGYSYGFTYTVVGTKVRYNQRIGGNGGNFQDFGGSGLSLDNLSGSSSAYPHIQGFDATTTAVGKTEADTNWVYRLHGAGISTKPAASAYARVDIGSGITLGNGTGAATATLTGTGNEIRSAAHFEPSATNTYDSGASSLRWRNLFAATVYTDSAVMPEISDPAAPAANNAILYVRDNGAGKTQLVVRFPTGAVQVIATEP